MPGKTAKSAPLPPFGLTGMTALVRAATLSCENAGNLRERGKIAKMHARSGVIRGIPVDYSRRALLGASGALALLAALRPLRIYAQASGGKLRIGIIGSGHIGGAIGGLWVKAGHPVLFASRHPEELKDLVAGLGPLAQNGTVSQALAFGDALFFAVPYGALPQLGRDYGRALQG